LLASDHSHVWIVSAYAMDRLLSTNMIKPTNSTVRRPKRSSLARKPATGADTKLTRGEVAKIRPIRSSLSLRGSVWRMVWRLVCWCRRMVKGTVL